jgi:hypothetical protein
MREWKFKGNPVTEEQTDGYIGFVYLITNTISGRAYIGRKLLKKRSSKPPLKGKKRKRRFITESNWRDYYGSSEELTADVTKLGADNFDREILMFCKSKGELNYWEAAHQFEKRVLFDPAKWYNGWISCKIHRTHLK